MSHYSLDLETLGTNVNNTILSFGICEFDPENKKIIRTLEVTFDYDKDKTLTCTLGTIQFWLQQAINNPQAVEHVFKNDSKLDVYSGLEKLYLFIKENKTEPQIWCNGTKFDMGMMEYLFKEACIEIPWKYNSDRCMRTLRSMYGHIDVDMGEYSNITHTALSDSIWQAKYISECLSYQAEPK